MNIHMYVVTRTRHPRYFENRYTAEPHPFAVFNNEGDAIEYAKKLNNRNKLLTPSNLHFYDHIVHPVVNGEAYLAEECDWKGKKTGVEQTDAEQHVGHLSGIPLNVGDNWFEYLKNVGAIRAGEHAEGYVFKFPDDSMLIHSRACGLVKVFRKEGLE